MCETQEGFDFSVDVKGLTGSTTYDVVAIDLIGTSDLVLGQITTNGDGDGELEDVIGLPPDGIFPKAYGYEIHVKLGGIVVLTTLPPFTFYDPALDPPFFLPFPLGTMLWFGGDPVDFAVFP